MSPLATGCGSVWLERSVRDAEAARSNRAIPTIKKQTGSSEAGARFLFPKSGMSSLLCGACACDAGGRRGLASKRHSCRPAHAVCGSGCRGDPRGGAAGTLLPSIAAPFFAGHIRCPGLLCCSLPGGSECGERDCLAPSAIPEAGRQAAAFAQKMIFCAKVFDRTGRLLYIAFHNALVAQLDRATGYEPVGQEFESLRAHHKKRKRSAVTGWPLFSSSVFFPIPGGAVSGPCHAAGAHSYPSASRQKGNRGRGCVYQIPKIRWQGPPGPEERCASPQALVRPRSNPPWAKTGWGSRQKKNIRGVGVSFSTRYLRPFVFGKIFTQQLC